MVIMNPTIVVGQMQPNKLVIDVPEGNDSLLATKWSDLSDEKKAEINEKRRQKYAALDEEKKEAKIEASKQRYASLSDEQKEEELRKRRIKCPERYLLSNAIGTETVIENPDMVKKLWELDKRAQRRKAAFESRMKETQEWLDAGGLFPWPSMRRKIEATRLFLQVKEALGCKCANCGTSECLEFCWRISPKQDYLAFVGSRLEDMQRVLKNPSQYEMFCLHCALELKLWCFAWIFSPYSLRNDPIAGLDPFGPKYPGWLEKAKWMYPPGKAIEERIDNGAIKSLQYKVRYKDGSMIYGFLRKVQYYSTIGSYPRKLAWTEIGYSLGTYS